MPPGAKRTPCAVSHSTALGRSSIHRPTWFSGVVCTAGFFAASSGCIRSTSTQGKEGEGQGVEENAESRMQNAEGTCSRRNVEHEGEGQAASGRWCSHSLPDDCPIERRFPSIPG